MSDLARTGPIHSQSEGVVKLVHSPQTAVHLVTLLEDLPVTETLETVAELQAAGLRPGAVIVNRVRPQWLPDRSVAAAADGRVDAARIRSGLASAGVALAPEIIDGLVGETVEHAVRVEAEAAAMARLRERGGPLLELPNLIDGVDLGTLYELAEALVEQGVGDDLAARSTSTRCSTTRRSGSWSAAAPAASGRRPPAPRWPCARRTAAGGSPCSRSTPRAGWPRRWGWRSWATSRGRVAGGRADARSAEARAASCTR